MKHLALAALLALPAAAFAAQPAMKPSPAQVDRLLEAMQVRDNLDRMVPLMMQQMQRSIEQAQGGDLTPEQQTRVKAFQDREMGKITHAMRWEVLLPMYRQVYADTLTPAEVDAATRFYSSPEGHAMTQKMPQLVQRSMEAMQPLMQETMHAIMDDARKEFATDAPPAPAAPSVH